MTKETTDTETKAEPEAKRPEQTGDAKPKGGPDWQRAAEDYRAQRDEARQRVDDVTAQLDKLKKDVEGMKTAEDVQRAVDEALARASEEYDASKAQWAEREKALVAQSALAESGCIDAPALLSHVDMSGVTVKDGKADGLDVDGLKSSYPYLFGRRANPGATEVRPEGAASDIDAVLDRAMGIKEE